VKRRFKASSLVLNAILILFVFVSIMPIFWMWQASVQPIDPKQNNPFVLPRSFTLDNLVKAWTVGKMGIYLRNSLIVAIPRVFGVLLMGSLAGYAFGKLKWKGRDFVFSFLLFGMMIPINAMLIPIYYAVKPLINTYWVLILPYFGLSMPFACFMLRAFYRELPDEIMESATIDGANKLRTWVSIMLPLTKPALSALLIFEFMWSWNDYLLPMLLVYDDQYRTLPLGLMYFQGEYTLKTSLVAAGVTICTLPIFIAYCFFQRSFVKGITAGAVKG
jgi:raffinose/stachyose/melibiose transport system permease protein